MMIVLRRLVLVASLIVMAICVVLLLNFTASNPTGRRYSSDIVSLQGTAYELGTSGEQALSRDLKQPINSALARGWRVCRTTDRTYPKCIAHLESVDAHEVSHRKPDFYVAGEYIVEVKNWKTETWETWSAYNVRDQISDYAEAAKVNDLPFWLFVRTNTVVPNEITQLARRTGGDVVYYLAPPGYSDPVDRDAKRGIVACGAVASALLLWELRELRAWPRFRLGRWPRLHLGRRDQKSRRTPVDDAEQLFHRVKSRADAARTPDDSDQPPPA